MTAKKLQSVFNILASNPNVDLDKITISYNHYGIHLWLFNSDDYDVKDYYTSEQMDALDELGFCRYDDHPNAFYAFT